MGKKNKKAQQKTPVVLEQPSEKVQTILDDLNVDLGGYTAKTKLAWNDMMKFASLKKLCFVRIQLTEYISEVGKVKKHRTKLSGFFSRLVALENIDLSSKTYIKKVLSPAKELLIDFEEWKKLSVTNMVTEEKKAVIEAKAEIAVEKLEQMKNAA